MRRTIVAAVVLAGLAAGAAAQVSLPLTFLESDQLAWFIPAIMGGTTLQMLFDTGSVPLVVLNTTSTGYAASGCSSSTFSITYGSGTVAGDVCSGSVQLASATATNQQTLVAKYDKAASGQSAQVFDMNGIMGWGPSSSSTFGTLYSQRAVPSPVFSTYLPLSASVTGELTVGGVNPARYTGAITYAPVSPNTCTNAGDASSCLVPNVPAGSYPFWMMAGLNVYLQSGGGAATLLCANCTGVADSGTSSVVGPDAAIRQIQQGYGAGLSAAACAAALVFTLPGGGGNVTVPLNRASSEGRGACTPVVPKALFSSNSGVSSIFGDPSTSFILGAPFVSSFYMVWDLGSTAAGPRLGFAAPVAGSFVAPPPYPQPPSPPPAPPASPSSGLSTGAIVGIVVGSVAGALLLLALLMWCLCFRRRDGSEYSSEAEAARRQMARPLAEGRQHVAMASLQARSAWPAAGQAGGGGMAAPQPAVTRPPASPSPLYRYGPQAPPASAYAPHDRSNMV